MALKRVHGNSRTQYLTPAVAAGVYDILKVYQLAR
jgi:hypothetical protein